MLLTKTILATKLLVGLRKRLLIAYN